MSGRLGCNLQGLEVGGLVGRLCEALDLHVAILRLPIVVVLHENGADEPHDGFLTREDADDVGWRLTSLFSRSRIRRMQLGSMLRGEGHVGEHVMLGLVHQPAEFLEPGP